MNKQLKLSALAVAIGAMMTATAFAKGNDPRGHRNPDPNAAVAVGLNFQGISSSGVSDTAATHTASVGKNVLQNAGGNIGLNVAAGDQNMQGNHANIATAGGTSTSTLAILFNDQDMGPGAYVNYDWVTNRATLNGNALKGAHGHIGVNVAAGSQNEQANNMAIATGNGTKSGRETNALASIFSSQALSGCQTGVSGQGVHNNANVSGSALQNASGSIGANVAAGAQNMQANDVSISRNHNGTNSYAFTMVSQQMMGAMDSNTPDRYKCVTRLPVDTATVSGNVLMGASGNIGMNVASGYNNMQSNTLAISSTMP